MTRTFDLAEATRRELNQALHDAADGDSFEVVNPRGAHAVACGITADIDVAVRGSVGYYCAGMHQRGRVLVEGNASTGLAENIMSGEVRITGNATMSAGATGCGGLVVVGGNAGARCGISMKGTDIVVGGNVGHMSAFMAQAGNLVVCGDAAADLGDSVYEARIFVRGDVESLGADCVEKEMRPEHVETVHPPAGRGRSAHRRRGAVGVPPLRVGPPPLQLRHRRRGRPGGRADGSYSMRTGEMPSEAGARAARERSEQERGFTASGPGGGPMTATPPEGLEPIEDSDPGFWHLRESYTFDRNVIAEIRRAANTGIYRIRGWGAKRHLPTLDDLVFLGASMSRYPLEGYREACGTDVVIGEDRAERPVRLKIPVTIAGMSFGSLSAQAKEALGRGASAAGTSTTTGDGGMTDEERQHSATLVYQYLPSRYGMNPDHLRVADAIEVVVGQGAKPGGGGMLLGQKITERVAEMRTLPEGIDQRSACRHPDWTGPDDLEIKIGELREITDWQVPIYVKVGAARPYYDTALAVKAGADAVVVDGMQGGTAATQDVFIEHVGIPTLAAIGESVRALRELGVHRREVKLIVAGGIRSGADVAKALALGADAASIGTGRADRHRRQRPRLRGRVPVPGHVGRVLGGLPGRHRPGRDHHPGPRPVGPPRPGAGRQAPGQLPAGPHHRDPDPGPSQRQVPRPQP